MPKPVAWLQLAMKSIFPSPSSLPASSRRLLLTSYFSSASSATSTSSEKYLCRISSCNSNIVYLKEAYRSSDTTKTIVAVYDGGIFKPLLKIDHHEHKHLVVIPDEDAKLLELQKTDLSSIIGIGAHLSKN